MQAKKMDFFFRMSRVFVAMTLLAGPSVPVCAEPARAPPSPDQARSSAGDLKIPLYFEANHGQTDASVKFFARAAGYSLYLTASEAVMVLPPAKAAKSKGSAVVRIKLLGANAGASVRGMDILPGHTSYFLGNDPSKSPVGVEQYAKVEFGQVYPGIDMVYYGKEGHVEHDFVVAPNANAGRILIGFEGAKGLRLDLQGNLIISVEGGELTYQAPKLYQVQGDKRNPVKGAFVLTGNNRVRFEVGDYIRNRGLVIDPALVYSSYLGGSVDDKAYAIAADVSGNVYLTGSAVSINFPGAAGHVQAANGGGASDVFVTKISASGGLAWSTYLGGTGNDVGLGIAVDGAGKVYLTGSTTGGFPSTAVLGPRGGTDAFAAAISADGTSLSYAVVFGGAGEESGNGIAVDAAGNAYVTGHTTSISNPSFPVTAGAAQTIAGGGADQAFVAKFAATTGALVYSTYLGGATPAHGNAIAIDGSGNAYVTGQTGDAFVSVATFPNVFKNTVTGASDAFMAELNPSGSVFLYMTYVGGSGEEEGTAVALDGSNNVYMTGWTNSADFPGPGASGTPYANVRNGAAQTTIGTAPDAFVFKLRLGGSGPADGVYATYLGAAGNDIGTAIAVDSLGNAYVTGHTTPGAFPQVNPVAGQSVSGATGKAFVTQVSPTGASFGFSSDLGGATDQEGQGIALDSANNIYVAGWTNSTDFPTASPFQAANAGSFDAFVTKISPAVVITPPTITATAKTADSLAYTGGTWTNQNVTVTFACAAGSLGVASFTAPQTVATEGANQSVTGTCTDTAGNSASSTFTHIDISKTAPIITATAKTADSLAYTAGTWTNQNVTVTFACTAGPAGQASLTAPITVTTDGADQPVAGTCTDNAMNTSAVSVTVNIATTKPTIAISSPTNGSFFNYTSTMAIINYADAGGSGLNLASLVLKLDGNSVAATAGASQATALRSSLAAGVHTLNASIADNAGNLTSASQVNFTVALATPAALCTISGIEPLSGTTLGGTMVTITGTGFYGLSGPSGVAFAGLDASAYAVNSSSTIITAMTPRHPLTGLLVVGLVSQTVTTTGYGTCASSYTYTLAPLAVAACGEDIFYPSPATGPTGTFGYCMEFAGKARVRIYNVIGDLVAKLEDAKPAGAQLSSLNTARLAPGVYLYLLDKDYDGGSSVHSGVKKFVVRH
ncbi:MAG: SBBP repeat-containing protein [Elusimicrobia bacterium]|nr:SBBP repeat-containing protein [Elusimicrobiota bacterium]